MLNKYNKRTVAGHGVFFQFKHESLTGLSYGQAHAALPKDHRHSPGEYCDFSRVTAGSATLPGAVLRSDRHFQSKLP